MNQKTTNHTWCVFALKTTNRCFKSINRKVKLNSMKFSLIKNDKSTYKDEIALAAIILVSAMIGGLLVVYRPEVLIFDSVDTTVFGVLLLVLAAMFVPSLIYRLLTNT